MSWNPGRTDKHIPGTCQAWSPASLGLGLTVACPPQMSGQLFAPPGHPSEASQELPEVCPVLRFQATVTSFIMLFHDTGSGAIQAQGVGS